MPSLLSGVQRLNVLGRSPSLPAGLRIYAVGDIHGRLDLLNELLSRIDADIALRPIGKVLYVFLGDYIDRGSSSRETIDRLIEHGEKNEAVFLKGNHELIAIRCLSDRKLFDKWMRLGGLETLISYGIAPETSHQWQTDRAVAGSFSWRAAAIPLPIFSRSAIFLCLRRFFLRACRGQADTSTCRARRKATCSGSGKSFCLRTRILARSSFTDTRQPLKSRSSQIESTSTPVHLRPAA